MSMKTTLQTDREIEEFNVFADELEYQWKKSLPHYTERELVEIFSPPKEMIAEKLRVLELNQQEQVKHIKESLKSIYTMKTDGFSRWFGASIVKLYLTPELKTCNQQIARLKRILNILTPESLKDTKQEEIERARQYPIYEITKFRLLLRGCGNKYSALCPFHEEKHASFYIYPETNTYHCFGCQANGDIIKLTMHLYGASFREAIKMLQQ